MTEPQPQVSDPVNSVSDEPIDPKASLRARLAGLEALEREFQQMRQEAARTIELAKSFRDPMPAILTQELIALWDDKDSSLGR